MPTKKAKEKQIKVELLYKEKKVITTTKGIKIEEFIKQNLQLEESDPLIVAAKINYVLYDLQDKIENDCILVPVDLYEVLGVRIYQQSLLLLLLRALEELYPNSKLEVNHSISRGLYCEIKGIEKLTLDIIKQIKSRMKELIEQDEPFIREDKPIQEVIKIFKEKNMLYKVKLFKYYKEQFPNAKIQTYKCGNTIGNFYSILLPRSSYLKHFDMKFYYPGFILRYPDQNSPTKVPKFEEQPRLFRVFDEHKKWARIMEVNNIGKLNELIKKTKISYLIKVAEAIQEKKIVNIAEKIIKYKDIRLVLIAGPSSSGKTTFAKRLGVHLRVNGIKTHPISIDNYFLDKDKLEKEENGEYDFEKVEAVDIPLLNEQLNELIDGHEVIIPKYSFTTGKRKEEGEKLKINKDEIIILEGIHGLNDRLTPFINRIQKFKIYINALTVLNIDVHNRIPTTDLRVIRRLVRDFLYRSYSAIDTLERWPSVRRGENKYIFPFQDEADAMFNSALIYELAVLKNYAEPLLRDVPENIKEYTEAQRLLKFLSYFYSLPPDEIPPTSILREFIGKSSFKY